jgi:hypothetical protein
MSKNSVAVDEFDAEEGAFEHRLNDSFHFDYFTCHKKKLYMKGKGREI